MTFTTRVQIAKGGVDPAPLVDVVFLLLLFFVLSSPFVMQSGFGIFLPSAETVPDSTFQSMVVTVTRDNVLFFNNRSITLAELGPALENAAQSSRGRELVIKADKQVAHGTVVQVMTVALKAGISVINIAARPEMPGTAARK